MVTFLLQRMSGGGQREGGSSQSGKESSRKISEQGQPSEGPDDFIAKLFSSASECGDHLGNKNIFLKRPELWWSLL